MALLLLPSFVSNFSSLKFIETCFMATTLYILVITLHTLAEKNIYFEVVCVVFSKCHWWSLLIHLFKYSIHLMKFFFPACLINCWEWSVKFSNYDLGFIYFSFYMWQLFLPSCSLLTAFSIFFVSLFLFPLVLVEYVLVCSIYLLFRFLAISLCFSLWR